MYNLMAMMNGGDGAMGQKEAEFGKICLVSSQSIYSGHLVEVQVFQGWFGMDGWDIWGRLESVRMSQFSSASVFSQFFFYSGSFRG